MRSSSLALLSCLSIAHASFYNFVLDCSKYPEPCNNDCYATYVAGQPTNLNWNKPSKSQKSSARRAAGCTPNPCCDSNKVNAPQGSDSCDEYPFASAIEGGSGSILRCTDAAQNYNEGSDLGGFLVSNAGCGNQPCTYTVSYSNTGNSPFCANQGGANDGFEYVFTGGVYNPAKRDESDASEQPSWELHQPDPSFYFPPHLRREVLLENGQRAVMSSRNLQESFDDHIFVYEINGTYLNTRMVRELHGAEKTSFYQPPGMQDWLSS